jgi:primosomal protein N' (replication factor Y)
MHFRQLVRRQQRQRLRHDVVQRPCAQAAAHHQHSQGAGALGITLLGPAPAPVEKVRNYWRFHILFKAQSAAKLQNLMLRLKRDSAGEKNARIVFDLDPQDML